MVEPRQRRVGAYAKLVANYASDDAIIEAGEKAELLFVRALAFLSTADTDGDITDSQVERFIGAGMRDAKARAQRLVDVGLWERIDGGYYVRSWIRYHETAEEKGRKRRTDRERKRKHPPDGVQPDSAWNPDGVQEEGSAESLSCSYVSSKGGTGQDTTQQGRATIPDEPESPEPPRYCPRHPGGTTKTCGPCKDARIRWEHWKITEPQVRQRRRLAERIARSLCQDCDPDGWLLDANKDPTTVKCLHPGSTTP